MLSQIFFCAQDIIDGYGSYPADMQRAECFQGNKWNAVWK